MINSKIAIIAAVVVMGAASPAFAQSLIPGFGTANVLPLSYGQTGLQGGRTVARQNGVDAFAMAPREALPSSNHPTFYPFAGTRRW